MNRKSMEDAIDLDWLEVTDSFPCQVEIGKRLYRARPKAYPQRRVEEMYGEIQKLATSELCRRYSHEELFFHSIYDFWVYGNTTSEDFYLHFLEMPHREKITYVTYCNRLLATNIVNDRSAARLLQDKYEAFKFLGKDYYLRDVVRIGGPDDFDAFLEFTSKHRVFVYKPSSSSTGIGVRKIDLSTCGSIKSTFNELLSHSQKISDKCHNHDTSFLIEELIEQDGRMSVVHPYSINAVRITTYRKGDSVSFIYPWFKVGTNKAFVTSAAFGTYDAGIDVETGLVNTHGYMETGEYDEFHSLTNFRFKGFCIPRWSEALDLARKLALLMPGTINYVGWDLVLTPVGWCVMEGNFDGDFMWQMFRQQGYRDEWEYLTGIKPDASFWWQHDK